jgi:hypothetical protein
MHPFRKTVDGSQTAGATIALPGALAPCSGFLITHSRPMASGLCIQFHTNAVRRVNENAVSCRIFGLVAGLASAMRQPGESTIY